MQVTVKIVLFESVWKIKQIHLNLLIPGLTKTQDTVEPGKTIRVTSSLSWFFIETKLVGAIGIRQSAQGDFRSMPAAAWQKIFANFEVRFPGGQTIKDYFFY